MYFSSKNSHFALKITLLLFMVSHDKFGPLRGVVLVAAANEHDVWPFDDLNINMEAHGNSRHEQSPVGKGLYLDGTYGTYIKLQGHNTSCLGHPSDCDITIGLFLKLMPKSGLQIYFGNKDADDTLYEGINIYLKGSFRVMVYGKDKYCSRFISPPLGVWFYLGIVWEKVGNLAVYVDSWFSNSIPSFHCGNSPSGLRTREDYFLGRNTFPIAYYKDLNIWYSKQLPSVLDGKLNLAFDNGPYTEISLKTIFSDLVYNSVNADQWKTDFYSKVNEIYIGDTHFTEIKNVSSSESDGVAAVSFTLKFSRITWQSMLTLQLAMENGTFLGSIGFLEEASCENKDNDNFICEAPKNAVASIITYNTITITMDRVFVQQHDNYFYGYRILYKNLDDPDSHWAARSVIRSNVPPIMAGVYPLRPYTNYCIRVSGVSFQSEGIISEALTVRTAEWVPSVGPEIDAYHNTSSTSIYFKWNHSISQKLANGILIGYRVAWDEDRFSAAHPNDSKGYVDVGLDVSDYTVTSLHKYWLYRVSVAGRTSVGHGVYTKVTLMTDSDAPSASPSNVRLYTVNATALKVYWNEVPTIHQNGVILGYRIRLQQEDGNSTVEDITVAPDARTYILSDLLAFQNYSTEILAYTIKGDGPLSKKLYQMTDESVPSLPPSDVQLHMVNKTALNVSWNNVPSLHQNGVILGYRLYLQRACRNSTVWNVTVGSDVQTFMFSDLLIFKNYSIEILAYTIKGDGPLSHKVYQMTDESAPSAPPSDVQLSIINNTALKASWNKVPSIYQNGVILGYRFHFQQEDGNSSVWNITVGPDAHVYIFSDLLIYQNYSIEILAYTIKGNGPLSKKVYQMTDESAPSAPPSNVQLNMINNTALNASWNKLPSSHQNGVILGYRLRLQREDGNFLEWNITVGPDVHMYMFSELSIFQNYSIQLMAFTNKGVGPWSKKVYQMTDQSAPSAPPSDVQLRMVNETTLRVSWNSVPSIHHNGVIMGYRLQLQQEDDKSSVWHITVAPDVHSHILSDLRIFQNYSIQLLTFTIKGDGPLSEKVYQMTDESVPINFPVNLTAHNVSSSAIYVSWAYNDNPRLVHGYLQSFILYIMEANASDVFKDNAILRAHETDTQRNTIVDGLEIYRLYNVSIAASTVKGVGPRSEFIVVRTHGKAPGASPQNLTAYNTSSSSLFASWNEIVAEKRHGNMEGYKLFFYKITRKNGLQSLENHTYELSVVETNLTGLSPYTKYRLDVLGFNKFGDGPVVTVEVFTDEGTPNEPYSNLTVYNTSSTSLVATWKPVPECCQSGIIKGYHVTLTDSGNSSITITKNSTDLNARFVNLKKFHVYQICVTAFTSKGPGPKVSSTVSTDQDVPEAYPQYFTGFNISQTEIQLFWAPVTQDKANGIVIGYNISYKRTEWNLTTEYKRFNGSTLQAIIDGLEPFTIYKLSVRALTIKGPGPPSPLITVRTEEEGPQVAPASFQGVNSSSTSIVLNWDPIPEEEVAGVLRRFYITYRQIGTTDNTINNITVPITNTTVEITNLRKYTSYSFQIAGVTKFLGAATGSVIVTTDEDIPSLPPQKITLHNSSSTSILVQWKPIPENHVHGILLGITLFYQSALRDNSIVFSSRARRSRATEDEWSEYTNITLPPNALSFEMTDLKKFTNYSVVILGFTSKGDGNVTQRLIVSTDEDVPSMPPSNFLSRSGSFKIDVIWDPVPDGYIHGILLGYHIYYTKNSQNGREVTSEPQVITVGVYEHNTTIMLLDNFATYTLEIAAFTIKGDGVRSKMNNGSTCRCPREFTSTWYPFPPYIKYDEGTVGGFLPKILEDAVEYCCRDCLLADGQTTATINYELDGKGKPAQKADVPTFVRSIDSQTDFSFPVNVHKGQKHYHLHPHLELAKSPGIAFIAVVDHKVEGIAAENLFLETWPLLLITSIVMVVVGILMWAMETRSNRAEFPRSFLQGAYEGFWWAFITSTTVGYGDRCPKGVLSRCFAIAWALCGLVVIAILTGKITSALTNYRHLETNVELYGAEDRFYATFIVLVRDYKTYEEVSKALRDGEVKGALVDLYVLSSHKDLFDDPRFRIIRVYDYKASYGVVLAGQSMKLEKCFSAYTRAHVGSVIRRIEENVNSLRKGLEPEPEHIPDEQQSTRLFNVDSPKFKTTIIIISSSLLLVSLVGLVYKSRRRKIGKVLTQSKDLRNEMSPIVDRFMANIKAKVEVLSQKHRQERRHLMRVERERVRQQATGAVNECYEVLSLRDIRQEWSPRAMRDTIVEPSLSRNSNSSAKECSLNPVSVKGFKVPWSNRRTYNLPMWPFTGSRNHLPSNVTPTSQPETLPLRGTAPTTLESNVRVIDETHL